MSKKNVAESALMISMFTLLSKGMGFLREVLIASKYGSGMETDTYFVAMTATTIIMGALGTALNTTLIPIFSEIRTRQGRKGELKYLNNIFNLILLTTMILGLLSYVFSPLIIRVLAKGFEGAQFDLAVKLNRMGTPIIIFLGMTYVLSGFLQSNEVFGPHAIMGIPYNLVFLLYLLFLASDKSIEGLMIVSVIAASTQTLIQVPAVRHRGYRHKFKVNLRDPNLKKALFLVVPVLLGSGVRQINAVVDKTLASELVEGSISALTYSNRIKEMVISVFVMAITTVVFPKLSQAFADQDEGQIEKIFHEGVNIILLITVPATVGLILLSEPIVRIFFERNAFDSQATLMTSAALVAYSVGLVGASLRLMLNRVFYSFHDTKTPMINGGLAVILNIVLNLLLIKPLGHSGLALATSAAAIFTTILLLFDLRRKMNNLGYRIIFVNLLKTSLASVIMGIGVYLVYFKLGGIIISSKLTDLLVLLLAVLVGVIIYFISCLLLKIDEVNGIIKFLKNR